MENSSLKKILKLVYFISKTIHFQLAYTIRYIIYRKSVLEPENLIFLNISERAFLEEVYKIDRIIFKKKLSGKLNIGIMGTFSHNFMLTPSLIKAIPMSLRKHNIYLYELCLDAKNMSKIARSEKFQHEKISIVEFKSKFKRIYCDSYNYKEVADSMNSNGIDVLLLFYESTHRYTSIKLLNSIYARTICFNGGNIFIPHPRVEIQSKIQLPPCWKVEDKKLINSSGQIIDEYQFIENLFYYDKRDIETPSSINGIFDNVIFTHGRLSKILQEEYLEIISELLDKDKKRKFIFMGLDDQNSLSKISTFFQQKDQTKQIKYLGSYSQSKDENGKISDKNWQLCKDYLKHSAVFLNPFPKGAGSSRIEAFASGLPVIDFEIDFMDCNNKDKKAYILEPLIKQYGTAYSKEEYLELAEKAFTDLDLRSKIIEDQYRIVNEFCDEKVFWGKVLDAITLSEKL